MPWLSLPRVPKLEFSMCAESAVAILQTEVERTRERNEKAGPRHPGKKMNRGGSLL